MKPLLEVRELKTHFFTRSGVVKAVNDVSFDVMLEKPWGWLGNRGRERPLPSPLSSSCCRVEPVF